MTKKLLPLLALSLLAGCGTTSVFDRDRPDEFAVTRNAPLKVPASFDLPAPQPGAAAQQADTKEQMLDAMFGTPAKKP
jgi:uncharacterized lipoprotein